MFERKPFKRTPIDKEKNIANAVIKRVLSKETLTNDVIINEEKDKIPTVSINIDYPREKGVHLLKKCSLQPSFKKKKVTMFHIDMTEMGKAMDFFCTFAVIYTV